MITPLYKPLGASTHQLAAGWGRLQGSKATHTGTLDPAAQGVVIVLDGDDRFAKTTYSDWKKEYVFGIVAGVRTDTHDLLGLPQVGGWVDGWTKDWPSTLEGALTSALADLVGTQQQILPNFSAKRHEGASYFDLAKAGKAVPQHTGEITIYSAQLESAGNISPQALGGRAQHVAGLVRGEFRQTEIAAAWSTWLDLLARGEGEGERRASGKQPQRLPHYTARITCSKRTYVRGIVRDLSARLNIPLVTSSIVRTKNGPYGIADCLCLPLV